MKPLVTLTDSAAEKITELLADAGETASALRIYTRPGGCSGFSYGMALDNPDASDTMMNIKGVPVALETDSLELIQGSEIDYISDFTGEGFRILNPNATSTCGCGSSFRTATNAGQPGSCE